MTSQNQPTAPNTLTSFHRHFFLTPTKNMGTSINLFIHRLSGSEFNVPGCPPQNSSYQRDSVFIVLIKPFDPMGHVGYSGS
jgi:hypothetical protein